MKKKRSRAFTLIELLVVMAIIGLLLSLSVPRYFKNIEKAKESVLRQDLAVMRDGIEKYMGVTGVYPESLKDMVIKKYLRKIPVDPMTERSDSWVIVAPETKDIGNVFDVKSGAQGKASDGSDYASW